MPQRFIALIVTVTALGLSQPAAAQLAQFCGGRIALTNVTLDPRSVSDARRPWQYSGTFANASGGTLNTVVTYVGPAGTISQATGRAVAMPPGQGQTQPLVQWPKTMGQPGLSTIAAGVRVECP